MLKTLVAAMVLVSGSAATSANAATVLARFSGAFDNDGTALNNDRNYVADVTLEVANGMASSGSGTFTFRGTNRALTLITTATPGNHNTDSDYPVGFISNGRDNVFGADQIYPLTSIGGLLFAIDAIAPVNREKVLMNFYNDNGTLRSGAHGFPGHDVRLYTQGTLSVSAQDPVDSAVPEPATWAMTVAGFDMMGLAMRRRRKVSVRVSLAG